MSAAEASEIFGRWRVLKVDRTGKRASAICGECGAVRELAVPALTSGQIIACPDCWPTSHPGSRRASLSGVPEAPKRRKKARA
jgi:hypothetical protein